MTAHPRDRHSPDNGKGRRSRAGSGERGATRGNHNREQQGDDAARDESRSTPRGERSALPENWYDDRARSFSRYLAIDEESE